MVVEDDAPIRELLVDVLRTEGYEVDEASDGLDALKELAGAHPDLIVLDLMMPAMNGRGFAAACHDRTQRRKVPILLISLKSRPPRERPSRPGSLPRYHYQLLARCDLQGASLGSGRHAFKESCGYAPA